MNIGRYQILWWPRWKPFFFRPRASQRDWGLYRGVYQWIVYVWPFEVRRFKC